MEEFNLSKELQLINDQWFVQDRDVKEFIKRLKNDLMTASDLPDTTEQQTWAFDHCLERIDKLAGEKLI
jgi:hypothetical protein